MADPMRRSVYSQYWSLPSGGSETRSTGPEVAVLPGVWRRPKLTHLEEAMMSERYMESNLDMPMRQVLEILQERSMSGSTYFGVPAIKCPLDAWVYQEIICEQRPEVIVEIGVYHGGGTLMLAHLCDLLNHGRVVGVDVDLSRVPESVRSHPRVELVQDDALSAYARVSGIVQSQRALVIEDSSHTYENTLAVLRAYCGLVPIGGYFIVEDGICHHGLDVGPSPGPFEAIESFVSEEGDFIVDRSRESFFITWNPRGYLRRIR